jgi:pyrimidine oxygenase
MRAGLFSQICRLFLLPWQGVNTPTAFAPVNDRLAAATAKTGRKVETFVLMMVIADESDEAAQAKWQHYRDGVDEEAVAWLREQGRPMPCRRPRMSTSWPLRIGGEHQHGHAGGLLRHGGGHAGRDCGGSGTGGVLLTFDDFVKGSRISARRSSR